MLMKLLPEEFLGAVVQIITVALEKAAGKKITYIPYMGGARLRCS
jgi:tripartite-type tricarboxylate transporter receptor subunit TctC